MKKTVKSILSLSLVIAMIFTLGIVNVSAASLAHTATLSATTSSGAVGDTVTVSVNIDSTTAISAYGFKLKFDPNVFELATGSYEDLMDDEGWEVPNCINRDWADDYLGLSNGKKWGLLNFGFDAVVGTITVAGAKATGITAGNNVANLEIGSFDLKVKVGAAAGASSITLIESETIDGGETLGAAMIFTPITYTVEGGAPATQYTLTAGTATNGAVTFAPAGGTYDAGTSVTVTATPDVGYRLVAFTGASTSATSPVSIIMDGNKTIGATFELIPVVGAALAIGSKSDVHAGDTFTVDVTASNIPALTENIEFAVDFDSTTLDYVSTVKGAKLAQVEGVATANKLGVAGIITVTETLEANDVVATITFKVKDGIGAVNKTLTLSEAKYGDPLVIITNLTLGTVNITLDVDYEALAEIAVAAYETGALTTLAEVATAEGKKAAATAAVALVTDATAKAAFNLRISTRDGVIAAARTALEAAAAVEEAVDAVNSGTFAIADLTTLGITDLVAGDSQIYALAIDYAQYKKPVLTQAEIQAVIAIAKDKTLIKGDVSGSDGIHSNDAVLVKNYALASADLFLTASLEEIVTKAMKADYNNDGVIDALDITAVLIEVARLISSL